MNTETLNDYLKRRDNKDLVAMKLKNIERLGGAKTEAERRGYKDLIAEISAEIETRINGPAQT